MDLVKRLESLQRERSEDMPFSSLREFQEWVDEVQPLLSFNKEYSNTFHNVALNAVETYNMNKISDSIRSMNSAFGVLNQAIISVRLENEKPNKAEELVPLSVPDKLTIGWLIQHVEIKYWIVIFSFIVACFTSGIYVGQSKQYQQLFGAKEERKSKTSVPDLTEKDKVQPNNIQNDRQQK